MAVTGLIMILFLIAHAWGNYKLFSGQEAFDGYSAYLRTVGEPILPYSGALWIMRTVLLISVVAHIWAAVVLWARMRRATAGRGSARYATRKSPRGVQRSYASFTLRWGGVVIALFVVYHVLHLTVNVIAPGGASDSPYQRMVGGFAVWWVVLSYTVALLALGFHLRHGFWEALASLGANRSRRQRRIYSGIALALALAITIGFLIPPYAVLLGYTGT
nr:succinate dehydrogenase cytochrome b subunit [Brevibacterium daeguense]